MSQKDHHRGRNHVEDKFLGRSGLHPRAAGHEFRTDNDLDGDFGFCGHRRALVAGYAGSQETVFPGSPERSHDIGSRAGSSDADKGVIRRRAEGKNILPSLLGIILGPFHGISDGLVTACHESDELVPYAVGRRNLGGVHDAQPAACPGTQVEDPSSPLHPFDDCHDHSLDHRNLSRDGLGDLPVLGVDRPKEFPGGHPVQIRIQ